MNMLQHPMYRKVLQNEKVPLPTVRQTFCFHLGKELGKKSNCKAANEHDCDLLNKKVTPNADCQTCNDYEV